VPRPPDPTELTLPLGEIPESAPESVRESATWPMSPQNLAHIINPAMDPNTQDPEETPWHPQPTAHAANLITPLPNASTSS
jgi:hypothetical protein